MLKIAVCDDEAFAVMDISDKIKEFFLVKNHTVSICRFLTGEDLLKEAVSNGIYYDAIFLDIGMSKTNGIEVAKTIRENGIDSTIIFITALKEYVFDAFEVTAANYLLKPLDRNKLYFELEKLINKNDSTADKFLVINNNSKMVKLDFSSILYCEVLNHKIFIHQNGNQYQYTQTADILERSLSQDFFRCHKSYIVNLNHVINYNSGHATLYTGHKIPVATRRHTAFLKALLSFTKGEVTDA